MGVSNKEIVSTAKDYKGKLKYVFGSDAIEDGTGDCSSYTEHVFKLYGLDIGPNTNAQYQQGYSIEKEKAMGGDLVFFKDTYNSGHIDGVSHVGIMVDNNNFIHLSSSGCKVSSLDNSYYKSHFLAIKRLREVDYENVEHEAIVEESTNETTYRTESDTDLKWWGDIVKVVVIVLIICGGVTFLSLSFLGSVKIPKVEAVKNLVKVGAENE